MKSAIKGLYMRRCIRDEKGRFAHHTWTDGDVGSICDRCGLKDIFRNMFKGIYLPTIESSVYSDISLASVIEFKKPVQVRFG